MLQDGNRDSVSPSGGGIQDKPVRDSMWSSARGKSQIFLDVVLVVAVCLNLYWVMSLRTQLGESASLQADQYKLLSSRLDSSDKQLAQLSGEITIASEKLGLTAKEVDRAQAVTASIRRQQHQTAKKLNEAIAQKASAEELMRLQSEADQKFNSLSGDIAETNAALTGTQGALSGAIARTHDELVALAHRSDRDYFEFAIPHKKGRSKVGGVAIELTKTDLKRNRFTINLYYDDKRIQQRDRALLEPVLFYVSGASNAVELVVNELGKNKIAGYVCTPRGLYASVPNVLSERPGI